MREIFGNDATGKSAEDYAATSTYSYVRSQVQIAFATPQAKGRKLSALEALRAYGIDVLAKVAADGAATLVDSRDEPSSTLKRRREQLGLDIKDLAKITSLSVDTVKGIETPGKPSKIRDIERVSVALALDERVVGFKSDVGDADLGVRLRELRSNLEATRLDASSVLKLAEAGWIIARQNELGRTLKIRVHPTVSKGTLQSDDYRYRTAERGYELAAKFRSALGIKPEEPIASVRDLIERKLGVPLVQDKLSSKFAGATIANGPSRGIVVNEEGQNEKATVRRMTLAHEIGHLIGDPDHRLNKLRVDSYDLLTGSFGVDVDAVERRANGFAVAFLAPPEAVRAISRQCDQPTRVVETVANTFGISKTAALNHVKNVTSVDTSAVSLRHVRETVEWAPNENLTLDFFPIASTPLSKRGRFASLVAKAHKAGHISEDTAASWLNTDPHGFKAGADTIVELQG